MSLSQKFKDQIQAEIERVFNEKIKDNIPEIASSGISLDEVRNEIRKELSKWVDDELRPKLEQLKKASVSPLGDLSSMLGDINNFKGGLESELDKLKVFEDQVNQAKGELEKALDKIRVDTMSSLGALKDEVYPVIFKKIDDEMYAIEEKMENVLFNLVQKNAWQLLSALIKGLLGIKPK